MNAIGKKAEIPGATLAPAADCAASAPVAFHATAPAIDDDAGIHRYQMAALSGLLPLLAGVNLFNSAVTAAVLFDHTPAVPLFSWLGTVWLAVAIQIAGSIDGRRQAQVDQASKRALARVGRWSLAMGLLWGTAGLFLFPPDAPLQQLFLAFVLGGMAAGMVASMSSVPTAARSFIFASLVPLILRLGIEGSTIGYGMIALAVVFLIAMHLLIGNGYRSFVGNIRVRIENTRLMQESARAQDLLRDAIESISDGFLLYDDQHRLMAWNRRFEEFWPELAPLAVKGTPYQTLARAAAACLDLGAESSEEWVERRVAHRDNPVGKLVVHMKSGRWLRLDSLPTSTGGIVTIQTDITRLKQQEQSLRNARDQAEAASQAKSRFLANMSHELRTPLNAVIGFSEIMRGEMFGPLGNSNYEDYIRDIHDSGKHLLSLINDILDLSKIEANHYDLDESTENLGHLTETALRLLAEHAADRDIGIAVEATPGLPPVRVDARAIRQVVLNLAGNAVKFSDKGARVRISLGLNGNGDVAMAFADQGSGMTPEGIRKALTVFGQADSSTSRRAEGSGLGLPLAKSLIELHGGGLEIDSRPGQGTTVTVTLPAARIVTCEPAAG